MHDVINESFVGDIHSEVWLISCHYLLLYFVVVNNVKIIISGNTIWVWCGFSGYKSLRYAVHTKVCDKQFILLDSWVWLHHVGLYNDDFLRVILVLTCRTWKFLSHLPEGHWPYITKQKKNYWPTPSYKSKPQFFGWCGHWPITDFGVCCWYYVLYVGGWWWVMKIRSFSSDKVIFLILWLEVLSSIVYLIQVK